LFLGPKVFSRAGGREAPSIWLRHRDLAQTSFIPVLTLGFPSNAVMALMIGRMIIQGIQPGPSVMTD
jgi:hypothetical protein